MQRVRHAVGDTLLKWRDRVRPPTSEQMEQIRETATVMRDAMRDGAPQVLKHAPLDRHYVEHYHIPPAWMTRGEPPEFDQYQPLYGSVLLLAPATPFDEECLPFLNRSLQSVIRQSPVKQYYTADLAPESDDGRRRTLATMNPYLCIQERDGQSYLAMALSESQQAWGATMLDKLCESLGEAQSPPAAGSRLVGTGR